MADHIYTYLIAYVIIWKHSSSWAETLFGVGMTWLILFALDRFGGV